MKKTTLYWLLLAGFVYACLEAGCGFSLRYQQKHLQLEYLPLKTDLSPEHQQAITLFLNNIPKYLTFHSIFGWTIQPDGASPPLYRANSKGIRADKEYSPKIPMNTLRIAAFGDSFTHCDDVRNHETWQERIVQRHPGVEVMNFGVPAFGLDQAFLRYVHEGKQYQPQIVLIGFMSENIFRHINVFRPFYDPPTWTPLAKPRFLPRQNSIELLENPLPQLSDYEKLLTQPELILPQLGEHDGFYAMHYKRGLFDILPSVRLFKLERYKFRRQIIYDRIIRGEDEQHVYNAQSEAFRVTTMLFEKFYRHVEAQNAVPFILLFPNKDDLSRYREYGTRIYAPLVNSLNAGQLQFFDLLDAFETYGKQIPLDVLFSSRGHYSPVGNQIIATYLERHLQLP